jgi:hypothetical protein
LATEGEVPSELSQIEAGNSLVTIIGGLVLDEIHQDFDQLKVVLLVEE